MDVVQRFLNACCTRGPQFQVTIKALYDCYREWAESGGEHPMGKPRFGRRMEELGYVRGRTASERFWSGIQFDQASSELPPGISFSFMRRRA